MKGKKLVVGNPYSNEEAIEWFGTWLYDTKPKQKFVRISGNLNKIIIEKV